MTELNHISVLIVDDHTVVRSGLKAFLLSFDDMELVGEAADGEEAVRLCAELQPDVVLMDMVMPGTAKWTTTVQIYTGISRVYTVVIRKGYGLGAIGMAGGNFRAPYFSVSWPTGEFGPMGLEGQVKLGYRAELEAIEDPAARLEYYEDMVAKSYQEGKAVERSTTFGIDDTIDPADTRHWLSNMLASIRPSAPRDGKKRPMIDAW